MFVKIQLITLFLILKISCFNLSQVHYDQRCKGNHVKDSTETLYCQYYFQYQKFMLQKFPPLLECSTCKAFITLIQLNGHTENAVKNLWKYTSDHLCEDIDKWKNHECKIMLNKLEEKLKNLVKTNLINGSFCETFIHCTKNANMKDSERFYESQLFKYILNFQNNQSNFASYNISNKLFHKKTPSSSKGELENLSEKQINRKEIRNNLISYEDFKRFAINLKNLNNLYKWELFEYFIHNREMNNEFNIFYFFNFYMEKYIGNTICKLCESMIENESKNWLNSTAQNDWKVAGYTLICGQEENKKRCHFIVDIIVDYWNYALIMPMSSSRKCKDLLHCKRDNDNIFINSKADNVLSDRELKPDILMCNGCQILSGFIYRISQETLFQNIAKKTFQNSLCILLFSSDYECDTFLSRHLENVMRTLIMKIGRNELCVTDCNPWPIMNSVNVPIKSSNVEKDPFCTLITSLILDISFSIPYKFQIETDFENTICQRNLVLKEDCHNFMKNKFPTIIMNMRYTINHGDFCRETFHIPVLKSASYIESELDCPTCLNVIRYMKRVIELDSLEQKDVDILMRDLCAMVHSSITTKCAEFFRVFGNEIKDLLFTQSTAEGICQQTGHCQDSTNSRF